MLEVSSFLLLQEGSVLKHFLMMGKALRNPCQLSALPTASMESLCAVLCTVPMAVQSIFGTQRHCLLFHQNRPFMVGFTLNYAWGLGSGHSSSRGDLSKTEEAIRDSNTRDHG